MADKTLIEYEDSSSENEEILRDTVYKIAACFNEDGNYRFGADIVIGIFDHMSTETDTKQLSITRLVRRCLAYADPDNTDKSDSNAKMMILVVLFRACCIYECSKDIAIKDKAYTVDEAVSALIASGCPNRIRMAGILYNEAREIRDFRSTIRTLGTIAYADWFKEVNVSLLKDVCEIVGIEDAEQTFQTIEQVFPSVESCAHYLVDCGGESVHQIRELITLIRHHCSTDKFEQTVWEYMMFVIGHKTYDLMEAVVDYEALDEEKRPVKSMRDTMNKVLIEQGINDDWNTYLKGVPLKDIMI